MRLIEVDGRKLERDDWTTRNVSWRSDLIGQLEKKASKPNRWVSVGFPSLVPSQERERREHPCGLLLDRSLDPFRSPASL